MEVFIGSILDYVWRLLLEEKTLGCKRGRPGRQIQSRSFRGRKK